MDGFEDYEYLNLYFIKNQNNWGSKTNFALKQPFIPIGKLPKKGQTCDSQTSEIQTTQPTNGNSGSDDEKNSKKDLKEETLRDPCSTNTEIYGFSVNICHFAEKIEAYIT